MDSPPVGAFRNRRPQQRCSAGVAAESTRNVCVWSTICEKRYVLITARDQRVGHGTSAVWVHPSSPGDTAIVHFANILDHAPVYQLWQSPFIRAKLEPVLKNGDLQSCRRVLDIGCGPGINAPFFEHAEYTGLDWNERYISHAQKRYGRNFISADARTFQPSPGEEFDFVLANSFFHHIDDDGVDSILNQVRKSLSPDGHVHILDLVLPEQSGIGRWLAVNDRGDFARPLNRWNELFTQHFTQVEFEPFSLNLFGVGLWNMVYFKGQARHIEDSTPDDN